MYKIAIVGHFAEGRLFLDGQTIKTKVFADELKKVIGSKKIKTVDTNNWKYNPIALIIKSFLSIKNCENLIILPGQNGLKVLVPMFLLLNKLFNKKLHYVVIGGWLPELLKVNHRLRRYLSRFDGIYVETHTMVKSLRKLGLKNVVYLPNFKRLDIIEEKQLVYLTEKPYKLCTFSRVMKEKGIENAIEAVKAINEQYGENVYTLDIYGQIDEGYRKRFESLIKDFPDYIKYKGFVNFNESVSVLKDYFALLFPTYYEGEGFPGTILDAFAAGVPVIATNWRYNGEVIQDKSDGLLYDYKDTSKLNLILDTVQKNPEIINKMRVKCIIRARQYLPQIVLNNFIKYL